MAGDPHYIQWYIRPEEIGAGYTVTVYDAESDVVDEYTAGNHPGDSGAHVPAEDGVSSLTLIRWAQQTAAETANEYDLDAGRVSHDRDTENEYGDPPEYAYTDEMPSGKSGYDRLAGWVIYDRDGDLWAVLPRQCEGLAEAITDWLNDPASDPDWLAAQQARLRPHGTSYATW